MSPPGEWSRRWLLNGAGSLESLLWSEDGSTLYSAADRGNSKDLVTISLSDTDDTGSVSFVSATSSGFKDIEALAWLQVELARRLFTLRSPATDVGHQPGALAARLHQNTPNPFNPATRIRFELERDSQVSLNICDVQGRLIVTLLHAKRPAGQHEVLWNGTGARGQCLPSGVYRYTLETEFGNQTRSMVLLK